MCKLCRIEAGEIPPPHPRAQRHAPAEPEPMDEAVIERLIAGDTIRATTLERAEAIRQLTDRGYSAAQIGRRMRMSARHVTRYRTRLRASVAA